MRWKESPHGASLNDYLNSAPKDDVKLIILDYKGQKVRTLKGIKQPGINRVRWDLSYEQTKQITLRTNPLGYPHVVVASEGWQPLGRRRPSGPRVAPGTYTVKLTIGEQEFTKNLIMKKDPHSARSEENIRAQLKLLLEIRNNINSVVDMINQIELIRKQIYDLKALLEGDANTKPVITTGEEPDKNLMDVQDNFFDLRLTGGIQDTLRWPDKLYTKLMKLAGTSVNPISHRPPNSLKCMKYLRNSWRHTRVSLTSCSTNIYLDLTTC